MPKKTSNTKKTASTKKNTKKNPPVVLPPVVAPPAAPPVMQAPPVKSEADKIWDAIRYRAIEMFALPYQIVELHCTPVPIEPSKLYVVIKSTATLPSLEAAIAPEFQVELADKFVIITRVPQKPVPTKR